MKQDRQQTLKNPKFRSPSPLDQRDPLCLWFDPTMKTSSLSVMCKENRKQFSVMLHNSIILFLFSTNQEKPKSNYWKYARTNCAHGNFFRNSFEAFSTGSLPQRLGFQVEGAGLIEAKRKITHKKSNKIFFHLQATIHYTEKDEKYSVTLPRTHRRSDWMRRRHLSWS